MISIIDELMRSCGGDSGGGAPVPSGDDDGRRQMLATMGEHHQLTVSRVWTAMSMLNRRTGHARFRRGPEQASSDQLHPPAAGGVALDGFVKACEARSSASASGMTSSSSLPSTTTLATSLTATAGEGSVSNSNGRAQGRYLFQPVMSGDGGGHSAGMPLPLAVSMQQQQHASTTDYSPGTARRNGECRDRARSENDAGGGCHCSKKRKLLVKKRMVVRVPAGDELPQRGHPAGRLLVAQVRAEAHQGLAVPPRLLQVQHGARVPGAEARGARPRRDGHAHRHLQGRPPPRRPAGPDGARDETTSG